MDGGGAGLQPDAVAAPLPDDLGLFQVHLVHRRHDDAVAGGLHLLQGALQPLVFPLGPGQLDDAGHQPGLVPDLQTGLLAQHLVEHFGFQLHRHPDAALGQVHAGDRRAGHRLAVQGLGPGGLQVLHAGDAGGKVQRRLVDAALQPVAAVQHGDPAGHGKIQLPDGELVQHAFQDGLQGGGVQVHAADRQHRPAVLLLHPGGQPGGLGGAGAGGVQQNDIGLAQGLQLGDDPGLRLLVARPGDVADGAVGGHHHSDGGVIPDHLAGAGLGGLVKGHFVVEPGAFDHAGLVVFLVAHGPLHHIAHAVDQPHPALAAPLQLQGDGCFGDELGLGGHDGAAGGGLGQLILGAGAGGAVLPGGQHQLLHEPLDERAFAAAHRPHHPNVDVAAGAPADLAVEYRIFHSQCSSSQLPGAPGTSRRQAWARVWASGSRPLAASICPGATWNRRAMSNSASPGWA